MENLFNAQAIEHLETVAEKLCTARHEANKVKGSRVIVTKPALIRNAFPQLSDADDIELSMLYNIFVRTGALSRFRVVKGPFGGVSFKPSEDEEAKAPKAAKTKAKAHAEPVAEPVAEPEATEEPTSEGPSEAEVAAMADAAAQEAEQRSAKRVRRPKGKKAAAG